MSAIERRPGIKYMVTYVGPDGHNQNQGSVQGVSESVPAANLGIAVAVAKDGELVGAEVRGDGAGVGDALVGRGGDVDADTVLDKELGVGVRGELGNDAVESNRVSNLVYQLDKGRGV